MLSVVLVLILSNHSLRLLYNKFIKDRIMEDCTLNSQEQFISVASLYSEIVNRRIYFVYAQSNAQSIPMTCKESHWVSGSW